MEKWLVGKLPNAEFYSVIDNRGQMIALQIPDEARAIEICRLPELRERAYKDADIINSLAVLVLDGADSNDRDFAQEQIRRVADLLGLVDE